MGNLEKTRNLDAACTDTRLAATHFRVLGLIYHIGYVTQETLAKREGCDRSTVNRVMRDLRSWGYIEARR